MKRIVRREEYRCYKAFLSPEGEYQRGEYVEGTDSVYDKNGNVLETVDVMLDSSGGGEKVVFSYDSRGNLLETVQIFLPDADLTEEQAFQREVNTYDDGDHLVRSVKYVYDDIVKVTNSIVENGRYVSTHIESYVEGELMAVDDIFFEQDVAGNDVVVVQKYENGSFYKEEREFDDNGNILSNVVSDSDGEIERYSYKYEDSRLIEVIVESPNGGKRVEQCDAFNRMCFLLIIDEEGNELQRKVYKDLYGDPEAEKNTVLEIDRRDGEDNLYIIDYSREFWV